MGNVLEIKGGKTKTIDPNTNLYVSLTATYKDKEFDFTALHVRPPLMALQFFRKPAPRELYIISLTTSGIGKYATIGRYNEDDGTPGLYRLGDDLEIKVEAAAEEVMRDLLKQMDSLSSD